MQTHLMCFADFICKLAYVSKVLMESFDLPTPPFFSWGNIWTVNVSFSRHIFPLYSALLGLGIIEYNEFKNVRHFFGNALAICNKGNLSSFRDCARSLLKKGPNWSQNNLITVLIQIGYQSSIFWWQIWFISM